MSRNIFLLLIIVNACVMMKACKSKNTEASNPEKVLTAKDASAGKNIIPNMALLDRYPEIKDTTQIQLYIDSLNDEFIKESGMVFKSKDEIKAYLNDSIKTGYYSGKVVYAPDSSFKVYFIYGEGCGAYCHGFHESFIHWGKGYQKKASIRLEPLSKVHKLSYNNPVYLLIQGNVVRASAAGIAKIYQATVICLHEDSVSIQPFINSKTESLKSFKLVYENENNEPMINYDTAEKKLRFYNKQEEDGYYQGEYIYKNKNFYLVRSELMKEEGD